MFEKAEELESKVNKLKNHKTLPATKMIWVLNKIRSILAQYQKTRSLVKELKLTSNK